MVKATFSANPHGSMFGGSGGAGGAANPFGRLLNRLGLGAQEQAGQVTATLHITGLAAPTKQA